MQIYELIPKVMQDIGAVEKNRKNEQQKYSFRGIEDLYFAAHPAMTAHGVFCAPSVTGRQEYRFEKTNDFGKVSVWLHVTLTVSHKFYAPDGSFVEVITVGEGLDNSDKASNKAMSGAMKYALIELFCVPTQDIEDSDRTTPETGKTSTTITRTPPPPPVKEPEPKVEVIPEFEEIPEPELIDTHQRSYLSRRFRETIAEVAPNLESEASDLRHKALIALQESQLFQSKFVDNDGKPTQDFILKSEYSAVGKALVSAARSCKQ